MLIACKYEEIYPPELKDFVYITDRAYTKEDVLQMEFLILSALGFEITFPTPYRFLERYINVLGEN
jgi:cyclin B